MSPAPAPSTPHPRMRPSSRFRALGLLVGCALALTPHFSARAFETDAGSPPPLAGREPLFPFVLPWDDDSPGVTNLAGWQSEPAGARGFVFAAEGGLFVPGRDPGTRERIRFLGVNMAFAANFPAPEDAEKIAGRLAKFGVNCVRFHHMDRFAAPRGIWAENLRDLDPAQLERLDAFVAALKARGIYANLNLQVSRNYLGYPVGEGAPHSHKGLDLFLPEMIEAQKDFARRLLHHVNRHTGLRYADDPAVAFVEINNENGLVSRWWDRALDQFPADLLAELSRRWNTWLAARHGSAEAALAAWGGEPSASPGRLDDGGIDWVRRADFAKRPPALQRDWLRFLAETERGYWSHMREFLVRDLGVRSLVIGSQLGAYSTSPMQADMDVMDLHSYWSHPEFNNRRRDWNDVTVRNTSMVAAMDGAYAALPSLYRVEGKPYVLTEYNHSSPNTYAAEGFPIIAAYGAMQDWDGVFVYSYSHGHFPWGSGRMPGIFDIDQHPVKMATLPIAAALLRRGDVSVAPARTVVTLAPDQAIEVMRTAGTRVTADRFGASRHEALRRRVAVRLAEDGPDPVAPPASAYEGPITSDHGQLTWDAHPREAVFTIDTARTKAAIGFGSGRTHRLGVLEISPGRTMQNWSMLALSQMEGGDLGAAGHALLVACGYIENTGMTWRDADKHLPGDWGRAPTLVEGVAARFALATSRPVAVWALDERGQRRERVPVTAAGGFARWEIGPAHRTLWYELHVE